MCPRSAVLGSHGCHDWTAKVSKPHAYMHACLCRAVVRHVVKALPVTFSQGQVVYGFATQSAAAAKQSSYLH